LWVDSIKDDLEELAQLYNTIKSRTETRRYHPLCAKGDKGSEAEFRDNANVYIFKLLEVLSEIEIRNSSFNRSRECIHQGAIHDGSIFPYVHIVPFNFASMLAISHINRY